MRKLYSFSLFLVSSFIFSQNSYWTSYNFSIDGKDAETIVSLMDGYFKDNLPEGVSVILYENHFRDTRNVKKTTKFGKLKKSKIPWKVL